MGSPVLENLGSLAHRLFAPGKSGVLQGLKQRADLNGAAAEVLAPSKEEAAALREKGRVKVKAAGETLSVQYKNLAAGQ
jgi:hypothetical protein